MESRRHAPPRPSPRPPNPNPPLHYRLPGHPGPSLRSVDPLRTSTKTQAPPKTQTIKTLKSHLENCYLVSPFTCHGLSCNQFKVLKHPLSSNPGSAKLVVAKISLVAKALQGTPWEAAEQKKLSEQHEPKNPMSSSSIFFPNPSAMKNFSFEILSHQILSIKLFSMALIVNPNISLAWKCILQKALFVWVYETLTLNKVLTKLSEFFHAVIDWCPRMFNFSPSAFGILGVTPARAAVGVCWAGVLGRARCEGRRFRMSSTNNRMAVCPCYCVVWIVNPWLDNTCLITHSRSCVPACLQGGKSSCGSRC